MRSVGVITVARSDYGIFLPILRRLHEDPDLEPMVFVSGTHLLERYGRTISEIEQDGFPIAECVPTEQSSDDPAAIARAMGTATKGFAGAFEDQRPDILLVAGDRFEMHAAALAALPMKIPVAHLHGGELTEGAIDDALRHSMTKLSHLHFVSTDVYARRVIQLGEEPWRVTVVGAPSLDNLRAVEPAPADELRSRYGLASESPHLLVTFHPVTLEFEDAARQVGELIDALRDVQLPVVVTAPNADTSNEVVRHTLTRFVESSDDAIFVENFGTTDYFSFMSIAAAMVGNSSSGIIEAASFKLPVVNIGTRQRGRVAPRNVIHVGGSRDEIIAGIERALDREFREGLEDLLNPYDRGGAAEIILERLRTVVLDDSLLVKRFHDLDVRDSAP